MINLNLGPAARWGLHGLILFALSLALYLGRVVVVPMVIALLLAAVLWPAVQWLEQRLRLPWPLACIAMIAVLIVVITATATVLALTVPKMVQNLPSDPESVRKTYTKFRDRLEKVSPWPLDDEFLPADSSKSKVVQYVRNALNPEKSEFVFSALRDLGQLGLFLMWQTILILFVLFFLLLEGRMLIRRLVELFGPSLQTQQRVAAALADVARQLRSFLLWRTVINVAMALILGMIYQLLELSQPWTWALLTAVLLYVPYLGSILACIPPALDAFINCESPWVAPALVVFYTAFITIEGYFIVPVVMGRSMEMNATTVMVACLFWELVWGPAGLFLAMPVMAAIKTVCSHVPEWRAWANLMDSRDGPPNESRSDDASNETQLLPPPPAEVMKTEKVDGDGASGGA